jgi:hypothetical protein
MGGKRFYPESISKLGPWGANFVLLVQSYASGWGIPDTEKTRLVSAWSLYMSAQGQADDTTMRTKLAIDEATRLRKLAIKAISRIKDGYIDPGLKLGKVSATEYESLGLTLPDNSHTPKGDPKDHVEFEFQLDADSHRVTIRFRLAGHPHWGKGSYHAAEIRYWVRAVTDPAPLDGDEEGWHSEADTASPWSKDFPGADAGKRLWAILRWENSATGKTGKGPWSAIRSVIIP